MINLANDDTYDLTIHCKSKEEQQKVVDKLQLLNLITKAFNDSDELLVYVKDVNTYLYIRKGNSGDLTEKDRALGYEDYVKITEYLKDDSEFIFNRVEHLLLSESYETIDKKGLVGYCLARLYPKTTSLQYKKLF